MPEYAHPYTPEPGYSRYAKFPPALGALDPQSQQIAGIAATAATSTAGILVALGTIGGPVGAAIAGLAAIGVAIANTFSGCGETCVAASNIANQVEAVLADNLHHYLDSPIHYASMQRAALNNFDIAWAALVKACSNQALLQAGQNCISERQQGACVYHNGPDGWGTGPCWNWFIGYRSPISDDPNVVPDPVPEPTASGQPATVSVLNADGSISVVSAPSTSLFGGASGASLPPALLIGGALILAALVIGGGR